MKLSKDSNIGACKHMPSPMQHHVLLEHRDMVSSSIFSENNKGGKFGENKYMCSHSRTTGDAILSPTVLCSVAHNA